MQRSVIASALAFALFGVPAVARAQVSGQDAATAQALFEDGKRLMGARQYAEACPKLVESQRLDPGGGTLFAIALCHEGEGRTATAWADFNVAMTEARKDKRTDREAAAVEHIRELEPKLTRARVVPAAKVEGLEVKRDGTRVGEAQWGTPLPIDPGSHTFEASAPGKTPWKSVVDVRGEGAIVDVSVPALADAAPPPAPAPVPVPAAAPAVEKPAEKPSSAPVEESSQKTWAVVAGGAGIVVTAIGLGLGLSAQSKWNAASAACQNNVCANASNVEDGKSAGKTADISTVLVTVGLVGIAAGAVLWITAPSPDNRRAMRLVPTVTTRSAGLSLGGDL